MSDTYSRKKLAKTRDKISPFHTSLAPIEEDRFLGLPKHLLILAGKQELLGANY